MAIWQWRNTLWKLPVDGIWMRGFRREKLIFKEAAKVKHEMTGVLSSPIKQNPIKKSRYLVIGVFLQPMLKDVACSSIQSIQLEYTIHSKNKLDWQRMNLTGMPNSVQCWGHWQRETYNHLERYKVEEGTQESSTWHCTACWSCITALKIALDTNAAAEARHVASSACST